LAGFDSNKHCNGQTLASEVIQAPVMAAVQRVMEKARKAAQGPLWPFTIDVR
jgi:hypothetical protein